MTNSDQSFSGHNLSSNTHRRTQASSTLNRKYVHRPSLAREPQITSISKQSANALARRQALAEQINRERLSRINKTTKPTEASTSSAKAIAAKTSATSSASVKRTASSVRQQSATSRKSTTDISMADRKNAAIKSALASVATMDSKTAKKLPKNQSFKVHRSFGIKKIILALACAGASVAVIAYFVNLNVPDVSIRVAALQSGLDATYPAYVPRDYALANVSSEDNKISMEFTNQSNGSFTLSEEKSSWDSSALESNFVKHEYDTNYTVLREQGLTIYISNSNAAWVNGGMLYKITASSETLTKKQIKAIATSL